MLVACAAPRAEPARAPAAPSAPEERSTPALGAEAGRFDACARTFIDELKTGRWDHPRTPFDPTMTAAMPPSAVQGFWRTLEDAAGPFSQVDTVSVEPRGHLRTAELTCVFERVRKVVRVVFDREGRVTGLFLRPDAVSLEAKARNVIEACARGDFATASRDFDAQMQHVLPPPNLAKVWSGVEIEGGHWKSLEQTALAPEGGHWVFRAMLSFERERFELRVVYDIRDQIVGLFVTPPQVPWTPPPYARRAEFGEREVVVGSAPALPATLAIPNGTGPIPAVVLVHGSGPQDRDETIGSTKPFRDLAWGLATRGIAVLRYEKRSRQSPSGIVTQKEEVLDGARAALALLRRTPEADPRQLFVVGHSQGGHLAPRIAEADGALAGIVILAGPTRSVGDLLVEQLTYLNALEPSNAKLAGALEEARPFVHAIADPGLRPDQDVVVPLDGHLLGAYFLDERAHNTGEIARGLACRLLVLQGDRDFQVTTKDFNGWKRAVAGRPNAVFKLYRGLNHLFIEGAGPSTPAEYQRPGHVAEHVVDDIAAWIGGAALSPP